MPTESGISFANFINLRYFGTIRGVINKVILNKVHNSNVWVRSGYTCDLEYSTFNCLQ